MEKLATTLEEVAAGAPFDVATTIRLLAAKVTGVKAKEAETGGLIPMGTMDAAGAGATLDSAAVDEPATGKKLTSKKKGE